VDAQALLVRYSLTAFAQAPVFRSDTTLQSIAVQVTDRQGNSVKGLAAATDQRLHPPNIEASSTSGGTALYDALASTLCHMRAAQNIRQAVVGITDGADQNSRLNLGQLIQLTKSSNPQIFMIGFFERSEYKIFHENSETVRLVGEREIDNPLIVFDRLSKESGAEAFFRSSERGLEQALNRILAILDAAYTLAYYPSDASRFRKIEVKVKRGGVRVLSRRTAGSETDSSPVHFQAASCEVSAEDHPYPWELGATRNASGTLIYREDFSDPRTGWPNRHEVSRASNRDGVYKPGVRYIKEGGRGLRSFLG
jgi:hypothetical protein